MAGYLSKLSIGKLIGLAVAIPVTGVFILAAEFTYENYVRYADTKVLTEVVEMNAELNALTHLLQAERGRSATYLGGKAQRVPEVLTKARANVDQEVKRFGPIAEHFKKISHGEVIHDIDKIQKKLRELKSFRQQIDDHAVTKSEGIAYYSKIIKDIFAIGFHSTEMSTDAHIALSTVAMLNLGEAKEFAGRERGLMAGILAAGKMSPASYNQFNGQIASQQRLKDNFVISVPETYREGYKKALNNTGIAQVEALRKKIANNATNIAMAGITPKEWFDTTTARINGLRKIEETAAADIMDQAKAISSEVFTSMLWMVAISVMIAISAAAAGWYFAQLITKLVTELVGSMKQISEGSLNAEVPGQDLSNELGMMAKALLVFRDNAAEKQQLDREAKAADAKLASVQAEEADRKSREADEIRFVVDTLRTAMERLAEGDLSVSIDQEFGSELDGLRVTFNSAVRQLADTIAQVSASMGTIHTNVNEMSTATSVLSTRTEEQARSLQEASASIEEITATVKQSAGDANSAAEKARIAREDSDASRDVVESAVNSMGKIEEASKQISSIIGVIDEISFQTNLLALNAGVEAARAGESGKGFAVVAQEVRELAQRSTEAAQDIKGLIEASSKEVSEGVQNVTATGDALNSISEHVREISDFVSSIATATGEQSVGLDECNRSVTNLDHTTQQNAAMAEETTAVTAQLASDAGELAKLVQRFKLESDRKDLEQKAA